VARLALAWVSLGSYLQTSLPVFKKFLFLAVFIDPPQDSLVRIVVGCIRPFFGLLTFARWFLTLIYFRNAPRTRGNSAFVVAGLSAFVTVLHQQFLGTSIFGGIFLCLVGIGQRSFSRVAEIRQRLL